MEAGDLDNYSGVREVTAPSGGYTKGLIYAIGAEYVVALETIAASATGLVASIVPGKIYEVTKNTGGGEAFTAGQRVYVNSSGQADANSSGNTLLSNAIALAAAGDNATTVTLIHAVTADS